MDNNGGRLIVRMARKSDNGGAVGAFSWPAHTHHNTKLTYRPSRWSELMRTSMACPGYGCYAAELPREWLLPLGRTR